LKSYRRSDSLSFREAFKKGNLSEKTALILSSLFGAGLMPLAPGTFGTLAAAPPAAIIKYLGGGYECVFFVVLVTLALWSSHVGSKALMTGDPSCVVIDEAAGFFMAVFLLPLTFKSFILGFLLFRVFDIVKPFPIGLIDRRMKGGPGIVLDDLVAGLFANICARIILLLIG